MEFRRFAVYLQKWVQDTSKADSKRELVLAFLQSERHLAPTRLLPWIGLLERLSEYRSCSKEGQFSMQKTHPLLGHKVVNALLQDFCPQVRGRASQQGQEDATLRAACSSEKSPLTLNLFSFSCASSENTQIEEQYKNRGRDHSESSPPRKKIKRVPSATCNKTLKGIFSRTSEATPLWGHADNYRPGEANARSQEDAAVVAHNASSKKTEIQLRDSLPSSDSKASTAFASKNPYPYTSEREYPKVIRHSQSIKRFGKTLVVFLKKALDLTLCQKAANVLREAATPSSARVLTNGGKPPRSGIVGYYDYLTSPQAEKCRLTAFSKNHESTLEDARPLIRVLDMLYQRHAVEQYQLQHRTIPHNVRLYGTVFSTLTVNQAFRTALHTDSGDFKQGLAVLTVLEGSYEGVYLALPELQVAFDLRPRDVLLFQTDLLHGNTEPRLVPWSRLSLVAYLRTSLFSPRCVEEYSRKKEELDDKTVEKGPLVEDPGWTHSVINLRTEEYPLLVPYKTLLHCKKHQIEALRFAHRRVQLGTGVLLTLDMGMGKTLVVLILFQIFFSEDPLRKCLILCPLTLLAHWVQEYEKWKGKGMVNFPLRCLEHSLRDKTVLEQWKQTYGVLLCGYEKFRVLKRGDPLFQYLLHDIALCVLDEGHRLKNMRTFIAQDLYDIPTPCRVVVTGTPLQNDLRELYVLLRWVDPTIVPSEKDFEDDFFDPVMRGLNANSTFLEQRQAIQALYLLQSRLLAPVSIRRFAQNLPPKHDYLLLFRAQKYQQKLLGEIRGLSLKQLHATDCVSAHPLCFIYHRPGNRLSRTCYWQRYTRKWLTQCSMRKNPSPLTKHSNKLKFLAWLLQSTRQLREKSVVFSRSVRVLWFITLALQQLGYPVLYVNGTTPKVGREAILEQFRRGTVEEAPVLLLSIRAVGVGVSLVCANHVVLFDPTYNPTLEAQAIARCHRFGQTRLVYVYRLLLENSSHEHVFQTQLRKHLLNQMVLKRFSPEEEAHAVTFSRFPIDKTILESGTVLQNCLRRRIIKGLLPYTELFEDFGSLLSERDILSIDADYAKKCSTRALYSQSEVNKGQEK